MESNKSEQGQSPSARAAHHRGQNTYVAPARPAAPTRSAGVPLATSGATIASFFVRPQTTPAARAPQAPIASLQEPATATRATPAAAASPASATVPAVPAELVTPAQLITPQAPALVGVPNISYRTVITPHEKHPPVTKAKLEKIQ